jgi:pimeloyl-ACP methyl ester carboxylesterase
MRSGALLLLMALAPVAAQEPPVNPPPVTAPVPVTPAAPKSPAPSAFPKPIAVRIGADSNACGITLPAVQLTGGKPGPVPKGRRPLLVWLHGGMRSQNREKGLESHRALLSFVSPTAYYLCSPSAFRDQEWTRPEGIAHIDALIDYMIAHYAVDPKDINLVGVSDGCLGVITYAVHGKHALNRKVLISSAPQLVLPAESLPAQKDFAKGSWDFFQGGRDRLFPPDQVLPYLQQWEKLYPNAHLHYFPDGEHDFSYYAANAPGLLKSVLSTKP